MKIGVWLVVVFGIASLAANARGEGHICKIDRVEKTKIGVRVFFVQLPMWGDIDRTDSADHFQLLSNAVSRETFDRFGHHKTIKADGLDLELGDKVVVYGPSEMSCRFSIVDTPNGIAAETDINLLPGGEAVMPTLMVAASPRN